MRSGKPGSGSRQAKLKTSRLRASTGSGMPSGRQSAAVPVPAVTTTAPAAIGEPSDRRTPVTRPAACSIRATSPVDHLDRECPRLAAERLHQRIAVEPAFAGAAPAARGDAAGREVGKALGEPVPVEMENVGAVPGLERVVPGERRCAGVGGEKEVAALAERDLRPFAVDRKQLADIPQERDAEERDLDIDRGRELLADRARRKGGCGVAEGRILVDDEDAAAEAGGGEMIGGRCAVHGAPGDDDVVSGHAGRTEREGPPRGGQANCNAVAAFGPVRFSLMLILSLLLTRSAPAGGRSLRGERISIRCGRRRGGGRGHWHAGARSRRGRGQRYG